MTPFESLNVAIVTICALVGLVGAIGGAYLLVDAVWRNRSKFLGGK